MGFIAWAQGRRMYSFRRCVLAVFLAIAGARAGIGRAFTREVYVWQREFSPAVHQAIKSIKDEIDGSAILAAEISWSRNRPEWFQSPVRYEELAASGRPVGLVLRIGPYSGPFASDDEVARYLKNVVAKLLANARAAGLEPEELQVDFDCASSKLAGYRRWMGAIREATNDTRLVFTALPDWLRYDEFPALARAADGYVLQVHSLEKPRGPDDRFELCDPQRAWAWIEQAGKIGEPFRVALPTYGYRLAFDSSGKFIALAADGPSPVWPAGTVVRTVRSDPSAMASLVRKLTAQAPAHCTGVLWFRLPVAGDRLNWDLTTLKVVMRGAEPVSRLMTEVTWTTPKLAEVNLVNRGERDEMMPSRITAQWAGAGNLQTGDGLGGYKLSVANGDLCSATLIGLPVTEGLRLAPGRTRKVGWIRFSHETSLHLQIATSP